MIIYNTITGNSVWSSNIVYSFPLPYTLYMQEDRNLNFYDNIPKTVWSSNTYITGLDSIFILKLSDTGRLFILDDKSTVIWETNNSENL